MTTNHAVSLEFDRCRALLAGYIAIHSGETAVSKAVSQPYPGSRSGVPISGRWRPPLIGHFETFDTSVARTFKWQLHTDSSLPDQTKGSHLSSNAGFVTSQPEVCLSIRVGV